MASCLANDIGKGYEMQRQFLGLDKKDVDVDFIGFSRPILASTGYWEMFEGSIDKYITVGEKQDKNRNNSKVRLIVNPHCSNIIIDRNNRHKKHSSMRNLNILQRNEEPVKSLDIEEYVSVLDKKIKIS